MKDKDKYDINIVKLLEKNAGNLEQVIVVIPSIPRSLRALLGRQDALSGCHIDQGAGVAVPWSTFAMEKQQNIFYTPFLSPNRPGGYPSLPDTLPSETS